MKTIDRLKECFFKSEYYISLYRNHIYIINYKSIILFNENLIKLEMDNFILVIKGHNFSISRKSKNELDINGVFNKMEISNE